MELMELLLTLLEDEGATALELLTLLEDDGTIVLELLTLLEDETMLGLLGSVEGSNLNPSHSLI
jgi:hypothetical protein